MRRVLAGWFVLVAACSRPTPAASPAVQAVAERPRLVVLVVIDQWPTWIFEQNRSLFSGGIGRVLREGGVIADGEIPYASTHTAPGHAALATGATPRVTGVIANEWFRRDIRVRRPAEWDELSPPLEVAAPLGGATLTRDDGASGIALRVEGIADALRAGTAGAGKSLAVSFKARSACLVAGQSPDLAVWFEPGAGGFTTSRAYTTELPAWLRDHASATPIAPYLEATWDARDPVLLARVTGVADDAPGEYSNHGLGVTFPHSLAGVAKATFALQETPFADELVMRTARAGMSALGLGRDDVPDLLAISFSAHDYAGHGWGQASWEVLDLTLRLDTLLGELFETLDAEVGVERWAAVITSDHGATPLVEQMRVPGARRIRHREIVDATEQAFVAVTGASGPWVEAFSSNHLHLTRAADALEPHVRARALEAAAVAVRAIPNVGGAVVSELARESCDDATGHARVVCESLSDEAGDLFVFAVAGSLINEAKAGTSHDAPYDDNRRVPILVKAPGLAPQAGAGTLLQVAPTLAALLGVTPPEAAAARPLFGITRR